MSRLEAKANESHSNALGMKEEIKTLKGELLLWVNRWQELKLKKDKYKSLKRSLDVADERLLKNGEQQKVKIVLLKASLYKA